jgi:hypothetical protein
VTALDSHPLIETPFTLNVMLPFEFAHDLRVIELPSETRGIDNPVTPITSRPEK